MRVAVAYPPMVKDGKYPLLGQNRQFRYSSGDTVHIYPMVPSSAATMASKHFDTIYVDGINEKLTHDQFIARLTDFKPDVVMMETKTPLIKRHWQIIDELKGGLGTKVVLVGDHVSALPEESLLKSKVDYVLTGGDYDILFLNLCQHLANGVALKGGIWFRDGNDIKNTGPFELVNDLDSIPFIDRKLTKWKLYHESYLSRPAAYILSGRGCGRPFGAGVCSFCIWQHTLWRRTARLRSPANVASEIEEVVDKYKASEVFDDNESGAIWNKDWLREFYSEMKNRGIVGKVLLSSNASADALDEETCELLSKTGFRLLKIGLESANDETLQRLVKRETAAQIIQGVENAKDYGLRIHLTNMTGYPWESEEDEDRSLEVARQLIGYKTRFGDSLQASVVIAYPGAPLHRQALKEGWFVINPDDYEAYDMSQPVLRCSYDAMERCDRLWSSHKKLGFLIKSALTMRSIKDLDQAYRGLKSLIAHTKDF